MIERVSGSSFYSFKDMKVVPSAELCIDSCLSRTQRQTPTVVHPQYKISRIRGFYIRKIKFGQQAFHDKLDGVVKQFPRVDEIHPFYSELCNVLYNRDHYKLALGKLAATVSYIDRVSKDYVRLLKYADSLYKCKTLKQAALGRFVTTVKKLDAPLRYLEEVRQHMSRLPSINPHLPTLVLSGFPNVGKSSFMNHVSRANVDVQDYAFTTKSLYAGHFDYEYERWQVIDSPGILDRPLDNRNTIEMTAITALAHLQCAVLFFIDISGTCDHTVAEQAALIETLEPVLRGKPIVYVLSKSDLRRPQDLCPEERGILERVTGGGVIQPTSSVSLEGIDEARMMACNLLNKKRELLNIRKLQTHDDIYVPSVSPNPNRPAVSRPPLPCSDGPSVKDLQEMQGGAGAYQYDERAAYLLDNPDWQDDIFPEIFNGKNVLDFYDPSIAQRLANLEEEEKMLLERWEALGYDALDWGADARESKEKRNKLNLIREHRSMKMARNRNRRMRKDVQLEDMLTRLSGAGIDTSKVSTMSQKPKPTHRTKFLDHVESKGLENISLDLVKPRLAIAPQLVDDSKLEIEDEIVDGSTLIREGKNKLVPFGNNMVAARPTSLARKIRENIVAKQIARTRDIVRRPQLSGAIKKYLKPTRLEMSLPTPDLRSKALATVYRDNRLISKKSRAGEADRFIGTKMPQHLYRGKRGVGKADHR